jgi:serine/threonine-protein kinase 24/25/MST4
MAQVDVWALGISAIEMAEITPPRWKVHPLRVIFMISRDPPPGLADPAEWSDTFKDFLAQCLQKVGQGRTESAPQEQQQWQQQQWQQCSCCGSKASCLPRQT